MRIHEEAAVTAGRSIDPWLSFIKLGPAAMQAARKVAALAIHHDDFKVGAMVLATSRSGDIGLISGANQNLRPGRNPTKVCAEQVAMTKMKRGGFDHVIAMFVSGPVQSDTQSRRKTATLHSCGEDRELFWNERTIDDETLFVSVDPDADIFEIYEHMDFQTFHSLPGSVHSQVYEDPGFEIWQTGERQYIGMVDSLLTMGEEPNRALLARLAVTGQLTA